MNLRVGSSTGENIARFARFHEPIDGLGNENLVGRVGVSRAVLRPLERPIETRKIQVRLLDHAPKIKPIQFRWREPLGKPECPYAYRTLLNLWLFSIRVHEWLRSDDKRHFHDHPWWFLTVVLRGSYTDVSDSGRDRLTLGSVRFRAATHRHYVEVPAGGAVTLLLTGPKCREWGFHVAGKFKRPLRYFGKFGHPPCHEQ